MGTVDRDEAVRAAKLHMSSYTPHAQEVSDAEPCVMARYILQPPPSLEWFREFVERCMQAGFEIADDKLSMDELNASREAFTAELASHFPAGGGAGDDGEAIKRGWLCVGCGSTWPSREAATKCYDKHTIQTDSTALGIPTEPTRPI